MPHGSVVHSYFRYDALKSVPLAWGSSYLPLDNAKLRKRTSQTATRCMWWRLGWVALKVTKCFRSGYETAKTTDLHVPTHHADALAHALILVRPLASESSPGQVCITMQSRDVRQNGANVRQYSTNERWIETVISTQGTMDFRPTSWSRLAEDDFASSLEAT
jgi:hypothetical protein